MHVRRDNALDVELEPHAAFQLHRQAGNHTADGDVAAFVIERELVGHAPHGMASGIGKSDAADGDQSYCTRKRAGVQPQHQQHHGRAAAEHRNGCSAR